MWHDHPVIERRLGSAAACALVAWKGTGYAKSRLAVGATPRQELAEAMALDTLRALAAALPAVAVTTDDARLGAVLEAAGLHPELIVDDAPGGLNGALTRADRRLRSAGVRIVVACVADLPALRPESVALVLEATRPFTRAFVRDHSGFGTTMLVARDVELNPCFEGESAAAHRSSGALDLVARSPGVPADARLDVDTVEDLVAAWRIGVGPATQPLIADLSGIDRRAG